MSQQEHACARLSARVCGIGVCGPGLPDWSATAAVLSGRAPYQPAPTMLPEPLALPPAERRRAGRVVRLALAAGAQAVGHSGLDAADLPSVFSSSGGDGDNCHALCEALARPEREVSPTRFHNSVHNAPAGYWSIAHRCIEASTALCAYDASFGAGLLEVLAQIQRERRAWLYVAYDADYPPPLRAKRPIPDAFGVALVLAPAEPRAPADSNPLPDAAAARPPGRGQCLHARLQRHGRAALAQPALEALHDSIPAARSLPLLQSLATGEPGTAVLDYLDEQRLVIELEGPGGQGDGS